MYNILVVGAGYLGSAVARHFKAQKQRVFAMTRSLEKANEFEREEIVPVLADLLKPETLKDIPAAHFVIISVAPDISDAENYKKVYLDGIYNFLASRAGKPRPYLVVLVSSTSVWKDQAGSWINENAAPDADTEKSRILLASEKLVLESGFPAVIFRLSGIYGPGRNRLEAFKARRWPQDEPDGYMNMIHRDDAAQAISVLLKDAKEGNVYIGTDEEPVLRSEFCRWLSEKTGISVSGKIDKNKSEGKRLKNQRLKDLKFKFSYPTFREGYQSFMEAGK